MIYVCSFIRRFFRALINYDPSVPFLTWKESWYSTEGQGVIAGLLDTGFDENIADLVGADLVVRNFVTSTNENAYLKEHGTYSVTMLVSQGNFQIQGIAPRVRLFVANVVNSDGIATPETVVEAIDWLISSGVQVIAFPLGESIEREEISQQIENAHKHGVVIFAAAGNGYPDSILFPAQHPFAIAVGATDMKGTILPECARLPQLDLLAPGWKIPALVSKHTIQQRNGSSVACIIATGVAILALSANVLPNEKLSHMNVLATLRKNELVGLSN